MTMLKGLSVTRAFAVGLGLMLLAPSTLASPVVALTFPAPNGIVDADLTPVINLVATASVTGASIVGVDFIVCQGNGSTCNGSTTLLGTATAPPYQAAWSYPGLAPVQTPNAYLGWAVAHDSLGQSTISATVPFTVLSLSPLPLIALVAPSADAEFSTPTAPVLYATAVAGNTTPASSVVRVDFLDGNDVIGTLASTNSPPSGYAFVWRSPGSGLHTLSARATDSLGHSRRTSSVSIYVSGPDPSPLVALVTPISGQIYPPVATVPLAASASSTTGYVQRVEFVAGSTIVSTALTAPYVGGWTNPPPGNYSIVARAFDDLGQSAASAPAYIQVLSQPRPPSVVLTAPTAGGAFHAGLPLTLTADALSPDGSISHVDFFAGSTLIGSAVAAPYAFTWPSATVGSLALTAKAYDVLGVNRTSAPVAVTVTSTNVPSANITSPVLGAAFVAPATINLAASAAAPGSSVAKVEYFANGALISSQTTAPYSFSWTNVGAGSYALTAKVTDALGATGLSTNVPIVVSGTPAVVTLTAPLPGARFALGQAMSITAQASAPGSTITKIEFYDATTLISSLPVAGNQTTTTATLTASSLPSGNHALSAKVFAANGVVAPSPVVNVTVSDFAVSLIAPFSGEVYQAGTPIEISANAVETAGTITRVDFYADGTQIGSATSAPYRMSWSNPTTGAHIVTARAYDSFGVTVVTPAVSIAVTSAPTLQVAAGIDGSIVTDDNVSISGTVQAPLNSAIVANGHPVALDPNGNFFIDGLALAAGSNALTLTLNTQDSTPIVRTITVTSNGAAAFQVNLDTQEGLAPLTVNATIRNRSGIAFKRVEIDADNNGTPEAALTGLPGGQATVAFNYSTPGRYTMRISVYDANENVIYTTTRRVRAVDPAELGTKVNSVYSGLVNRLAANNPTGALTAFTGDANQKYADVFAALSASLPSTAAQLGAVVSTTVTEGFAEMALSRSTTNGNQAYMIYLIKGGDGVWRIESM